MGQTDRLELSGAAGSPYTRKMIGVLRYRHIPYSVYWGNGNIPDGYPEPKVRLLPTFFFRDGEDGERVAVTDSTPIIRRLETKYEGRSVIPTDPTLQFLNTLIEDYADEWLTKAMFHFRWAHEADWKNAAPLLVYWGLNTAPKDIADTMGTQFATRQIDRLYVVGSNDITAETIENSYTRLVALLDTLIQKRGFVLGARPSSADFAIYGQMTQLAAVDPTAAALTRATSMRVRAWVDIMEDLSGLTHRGRLVHRRRSQRGSGPAAGGNRADLCPGHDRQCQSSIGRQGDVRNGNRWPTVDAARFQISGQMSRLATCRL
jgi:glutathione S-transferase